MVALQILDHLEVNKITCNAGMPDYLLIKIHDGDSSEIVHQPNVPSAVVCDIVVSLRFLLAEGEIITGVVITVEPVFVSRLQNDHVGSYLDVHVEKDGEINNCNSGDPVEAVVILQRDGIFTVRGFKS